MTLARYMEKLPELTSTQLEGWRGRGDGPVRAGDLPGVSRRRLSTWLAIIATSTRSVRRPNDAARNRWFDDYVALVAERDVLDLARIRQREALPRLLGQLAAQTGGVLSIASAARRARLGPGRTWVRVRRCVPGRTLGSPSVLMEEKVALEPRHGRGEPASGGVPLLVERARLPTTSATAGVAAITCGVPA